MSHACFRENYILLECHFQIYQLLRLWPCCHYCFCGFKHTSCSFGCRLIICCRTYVCNRENLFKSVKPLCDGKLLEFWLCSCKNPLYLNLLFWLWHLSFTTKFLLFCSERCLINRPLFVNNQQHKFQTTTKTRVK